MTTSAGETDMLPLPLNASVMYEQYEHGSLYKTHFEAPYVQHKCQPRKIHLSPSSDVDPESNLYNATVTFVLDLRSVGAIVTNNECSVRTTVTYGRGDVTEGNVEIIYEQDDYHAINRKKISEEYTLVRFNFTSPVTRKYYESDLIHHVILKNLVAGRQRYWYSIEVELLERLVHSEPFFPPLAPLEGWFSSRRSTVDRRLSFRGSYSRNAMGEREEQTITVVKLGETPSYEFTTPPLYGDPTSIALVGDLGQTKNSTRTMARILDAARSCTYCELAMDNKDRNGGDSKDHVVTNLFIAGDLSYSDGRPERMNSWLDLAEPLLREVPFASIPGNHEIECDSNTRDIFIQYEAYFRNPNRLQEAIEVSPLWPKVCVTPSEFIGQYDYGNAFFSYKQGLVHTIFLNSYTSLLAGSKQREWLDNIALPSVDRNLTPWLVVIFHTPMYTTFANHYGELNAAVMKASGLRELFDCYGVNLVVSGHDHAYSRSLPLDVDGKVKEDGKGPIFWTLGAGGNREGHSQYRNPQPEDWIAVRNNVEYGFGLFFAPNRTHAHLQWIRDEDNGVNDDMGSVHGNSSLVVRDTVWIENYNLFGSDR